MSKDLIFSGDLPPLFKLQLAIDWEHGQNRARNCVSKVLATDDWSAINAWLATYARSKQTLASYRKEATRLILWAAHVRHRSISDLAHEDMMAYEDFIRDPQPAEKWIGSGKKRALSHPDWRPFHGPLSESSSRQTMIILNTMFTWFVNAGYLDGNPLALSNTRRREEENKDIERYLTVEEFAPIMQAVDAMPADTSRQLRTKVRLRWILSLLYLTGLRISEAVGNTMGQFHQRIDPHENQMKWWLKVKGKGKKTTSVPVSEELLRELIVYRETFGLPALPHLDEQTPLVFSIGQQRAAMTRQSLHRILKEAFESIADAMEDGRLEEQSLKLRSMSAHWLRHSMGTNLVRQGVDITYVRDLMRHKNISSTDHYVHTVKNELHDEAVKHKLPKQNLGSTQ